MENGWIRPYIFSTYTLAILGGFDGKLFGENDIKFKSEKYIKHKDYNIPFIEKHLNTPFIFVQGVNVGPIFYRKDVYQKLGGFDYSFSKPGDSGIHYDYEICFRAWLKGYYVGLYYHEPFIRRVGVQGTKLYGIKERSENEIKNMDKLKVKYWDKLHDIQNNINKLNRVHLETKDKSEIAVQDIEKTFHIRLNKAKNEFM